MQGGIDELNGRLDGGLYFRGTLGGNVITQAKDNVKKGITFYINSNAPTNAPSSIGYGAYLFIKADDTHVAIMCFDTSHFAVTTSLNPTTATSITWQTVH